MKTITTLLLLLLASPVFAETYVCSWLGYDGEIDSDTYIRTAKGFDEPRDAIGGVAIRGADAWEIIHEDELVLVLHRTISGTSAFTTHLVQLEKGGENRFAFFLIHTGEDTINYTEKGTCTVVE